MFILLVTHKIFNFMDGGDQPNSKWEEVGCGFPDCSLANDRAVFLPWDGPASPVKLSATYGTVRLAFCLLYHPNTWNSNVINSLKSWLRGVGQSPWNFNLPEITAIMRSNHLLKIKWFLFCRKGQNVIMSVPLEGLLNSWDNGTQWRGTWISSLSLLLVRILESFVPLLLHLLDLDPACGDYPFPLERKIDHLLHASSPWHDDA